MGKRPARRRDRDDVDGYTLGRVGRHHVAYYQQDGRRCRARLGQFRAEVDAVAALRRFAEARATLVKSSATYTIGQLWDLWLAQREADGFSNAIYSANWRSLRPHFAHRKPENINDDVCRAYARARFKLGRSSWTVNTEMARLRSCLQWAESRWHIPRAPHVWIPSRGRDRELVITATEAKRLLVASEVSPHLYLFVVLALTTGARHMAILDLTWDRVDFVAGTITYDDDLPPDPMSKSWRKGRATVPMNALARAALDLAHAGRQTDHVIEYRGRRLKSIREGFREAVACASLVPEVTPHTIRHSVATWLREKGVELKRISQVLGHADMRTTDLIYTHTTPGYLTDAVNTIDDAIGKKGR